MSTSPNSPAPSVRAAHARLAALKRHRPTDVQAIGQAERALDVALASRALTQAAAVLVGGRRP